MGVSVDLLYILRTRVVVWSSHLPRHSLRRPCVMILHVGPLSIWNFTGFSPTTNFGNNFRVYCWSVTAFVCSSGISSIERIQVIIIAFNVAVLCMSCLSWRTLSFLGLDRQTVANWLILLQLEHVLPYAGQFPGSWRSPQYLYALFQRFVAACLWNLIPSCYCYSWVILHSLNYESIHFFRWLSFVLLRAQRPDQSVHI